MKKLTFTVATLAALLFSANTFAGNGDTPKIGPANETEMTLTTPNDDPNAPPPPPVTYYMVVWNGTTMTTVERNYFNVLYNSALTGTLTDAGAPTMPAWPIPGGPYKYMPISSSACQSWFMSHPPCTGCRNGSVLFSVAAPVTTSSPIFTWGGCPL